MGFIEGMEERGGLSDSRMKGRPAQGAFIVPPNQHLSALIHLLSAPAPPVRDPCPCPPRGPSSPVRPAGPSCCLLLSVLPSVPTLLRWPFELCWHFTLPIKFLRPVSQPLRVLLGTWLTDLIVMFGQGVDFKGLHVLPCPVSGSAQVCDSGPGHLSGPHLLVVAFIDGRHQV